MTIAISDDHVSLAETALHLLSKRDARGSNRALLEADAETSWIWSELAEVGWLGLHLPEQYGGSGFGLEELVVVVEQFGRTVAPGPFVPTVLASALIAAAADDETRGKLLPGLAGGALIAAVAYGDNEVTLNAGSASGDAGVVLGGGLADLLVVPVAGDVLIVDLRAAGVSNAAHPNLDPARRCTRVVLDGAPVTVITDGAGLLQDLSRLLLSAEAVGVARECTEMAAAYAKIREQFGRTIATFQAVKHHCANMLVATEAATAAVWDAARAMPSSGAEFHYAAAVAATLAGSAADLAANLNIQVHGGIGVTWEHDAHLYARRATVLQALLDPNRSASNVVEGARAGIVRARAVELPPEAQKMREEVCTLIESIADLDPKSQTAELVRTGYANPHWPAPWGRGAGAVEQIVIEQEFDAAGIRRPMYGITGWVILTLIQHGTPEQAQRWVPTAMSKEVIWCQLFSEPGAGSDAAAVRTKATKVDGGWLVNGQKVWTSDAHIAGMGLITVRTNPDVAKHQGISTMVVDMAAQGVTVRPLRITNGMAAFNEVFFDDVFVPDADVVGPIDAGWTVARATLGNESVSIGGGDGVFSVPADVVVTAYDKTPERLEGGAARVGRYAAHMQALGLLNLRSIQRTVAGGGPGPEGSITKLLLSESGHEAAAIFAELAGADVAFFDGPGGVGAHRSLVHRLISIAGGTSEIKRNQIGERLLGLPRDPLVN